MSLLPIVPAPSAAPKPPAIHCALNCGWKGAPAGRGLVVSVESSGADQSEDFQKQQVKVSKPLLMCALVSVYLEADFPLIILLLHFPQILMFEIQRFEAF